MFAWYSLYENKVPFTKLFQASPCWHQLKCLVFIKSKNTVSKLCDYISFFWIRIIFWITVTFVVIVKIVKLKTLYLFSFSMILFKKYPLNSPINNGLIRITNLVFTNISQLKKKTSFYWTKKHFFSVEKMKTNVTRYWRRKLVETRLVDS